MDTTQEENQNINPVKEGPSGIRGWLILVLMILIIVIIQLGIGVFTIVLSMIENSEIFEPPWLETLLYVELIGNSLFIICAVLLLILMINHSKLFPRFMIIFWVSSTVFLIADRIAATLPNLDADTEKVLIAQTVFVFIEKIMWLPYLVISKRVKNTFIK